MLRMLLAGLMALITGGCAVVGAEAPLFSGADVGGRPGLKPGLWAVLVEECSFDPAGEPARWPSCANATLVTPEAFTELRGEPGSPPARMRYVLAAGDPRILQVQAPSGEKDPAFVFAGLRPLKSDAEGRIVEAQLWLALCEPPRQGDGLTGPLPPGLRRKEGARSCTALDKEAARSAVRRTWDWIKGEDLTATARWLRAVD